MWNYLQQFDNCFAETIKCPSWVFHIDPDSKVHGANMGPPCVLSAPGGLHVGLMNPAIWVGIAVSKIRKNICRSDGQVTFELYGRFRSLQILYSKQNYIHWVLLRSFEIHLIRQNLVNFLDLVGIVNATVYKTKPIFTGLEHGKCPNF